MKKSVIIGASIVIGVLALVWMFGISDFEGVENVREESAVMQGEGVDEAFGGFVVEEEVAGPEECVAFEQYDDARKVCYFTCATEQECDAMEEDLDKALEELEGAYDDFAQDFREFEGDVADLEKNADAIYAIEHGEEYRIMRGEEGVRHKKVRAWLSAIVPEAFSDQYLGRLVLYREEGGDGTAAFVAQQDNTSRWDVYVNMTTFDDGEEEVVFTLIHEFANILTLNAAQVSSDMPEDECHNYFVQEGCLHADAYLNLFYAQFWKGRDFDIDVEDSLDNYDKAPDAFVSEYAATNPGEDIAESFAAFVFRKESAQVQTIAEKKMAFFKAYPELVEMRRGLRTELARFVRKRKVSA